MNVKPKTLAERLDALTNAQLAEVYNAVSERQVKKFADHSTAVKRTELALNAAQRDIAVGEDGAVTVVAAGSPEAAQGDERIITVLATENPKGAFGKASARFAKYKTGMTIGEYVAAVVKLGESRRVAIRDLSWDASHGYIRIG